MIQHRHRYPSLWRPYSVPTEPVELDPSHPLSMGLIGYWLLNGDFRDYSVTQTNAVPAGAPKFVSSPFGPAAYGDGNTNYIKVILPSVSGTWTIAGWSTVPSGSDSTFISTRNGSSSNTFDIQLQNNAVHADIGSGGAWITTSANSTYSFATAGQFYHIVMVVTTSGWTTYVNGVQAGTAAFTGTPVLSNTANGNYAVFGGNDAGFVMQPNTFSTMSLYNRALSAAEALRLYMTPWDMLRPKARRVSRNTPAGAAALNSSAITAIVCL